MEKKMLFIVCLLVIPGYTYSQSDSLQVNACPKYCSKNYDVQSAFEIESLVPMFFFGGYHVGVGYRYEKFRIRFSVINGGTYDVEPAGLHNSSAAFKRFYKTSPGLFGGYNLWKGWDVYTYLELHTFQIEQKSTSIRKDLHSTDTGLGTSYQLFIGHYFYIQPGLHLYLRKDKSIDFGTTQYTIPSVDFSPVIRLGVRLWHKSE